MGSIGLPVRYSTCDVTYVAGCRGHVTRLVTTTWNNRKMARDAEGGREGRGDRERKGWNEGREQRRESRADDRPLARLYGTYAYTCPRESTTGFTFKNIPEIPASRAVIGSLSERLMNGQAERSRYTLKLNARALALAIIIHSNDDECLYPWAPVRLDELMTCNRYAATVRRSSLIKC